MVNTADMEKRPDEVSGMFDDVARGYDRTNDILSVGNSILWRIATVKAIDPQPGERLRSHPEPRLFAVAPRNPAYDRSLHKVPGSGP